MERPDHPTLPVGEHPILGELLLASLNGREFLPTGKLYVARGQTHSQQAGGQAIAEFTAVLPMTIRGVDLNKLIFDISPYKRFRLDYQDIVNDWQMPEKDDTYNRGLQLKHQKWYGRDWETFLAFRERHLNAIRHEGTVSLIPTLQWTKNGNRRRWNFAGSQTLIPPEIAQKIAHEHPDLGREQEAYFDTLAGLYFAAYCAPEVTSKWPNEAIIRHYGITYYRVLGPTQTPLFAITKRGEILRSKFIKALEAAAPPTPNEQPAQ